MLRNLYLALGTCTCLGYAGMSLMGWEISTAERSVVSASTIRQSPGGYRSYHFWHSGYHGGK